MKTETPTPASPPRPKKRKPVPEFQLSHEQRFWELYKIAFGALHAQFERPDGEGFDARFSDGAAELERSKDLALRAWNSACYACAQFEDDEKAIDQFNREVEATAVEEEKEENEF